METFSEEILAHVFDTKDDAKAAMGIINAALGIPAIEDAVTRTYTKICPHTDGFWYIPADATTEQYLGEPQTVTITFNR